MRTPLLCLGAAVALVLAACGDDSTPEAADYDGQWLMTELVVDDDGSPLTLRRDGVAQGIRADIVFAATGPLTGTLDVRQVVLVDGLIAGPIAEPTGTVAVEPDRWVMTDPDGEVIVFATALDQDHLVLTHDPTDPRDTATDPPRSVTVDRVSPWSTTTVGSWDLVSITSDGTTIVAGTCLEVQAGTRWGKLTMVIEIGDRLLFSRVMTTTLYSDAACTAQTTQTTSTQTGYGEEEADATLRMWAVEGDRSEFQQFSIAVAGPSLTLTRTSCLPTPACLTSAPTEVVVRRRP